MLKKRNVILAGLVAAVVAVGGYFLVGPGSGDGYGDSYSTVAPGVADDGHNHSHGGY